MPFLTGNSSHPRRLTPSLRCSNPTLIHQKNATCMGGVWCTRWGSNPDSTASEAVMLSNYTTSTFFIFLRDNAKFLQKATIFYYFLLPFCKRLCYNILNFRKFFSVPIAKTGTLGGIYVENCRNRYERRRG